MRGVELKKLDFIFLKSMPYEDYSRISVIYEYMMFQFQFLNCGKIYLFSEKRPKVANFIKILVEPKDERKL